MKHHEEFVYLFQAHSHSKLEVTSKGTKHGSGNIHSGSRCVLTLCIWTYFKAPS